MFEALWLPFGQSFLGICPVEKPRLAAVWVLFWQSVFRHQLLLKKRKMPYMAIWPYGPKRVHINIHKPIQDLTVWGIYIYIWTFRQELIG